MNTRIVAIYARVSTAKEAQLYALKNQKQYYEEILEKREDWVFYKMYVDEGISGTSVNKRKQFQKMIVDAEAGKFDLIITREVSRFARNTVDTLTYTRKLKQLGIEVYFIEDNIWSLNDEDGELRLTIMATLAQNESKKVSQRSKAGQHISFQNGVLYGNGNILGYDRIEKDLVINTEQAKVVKKIFELYVNGMGIRTIAFELERLGYYTATGKTKWQPGTISHVLTNSFYCGIIEYRKEYVADFLTHKRKKNRGEVETTIVKGTHEPIVSEEIYSLAKQILESKTASKMNRGRGVRLSSDVWIRKLVCECGRHFLRQSWHKKNGISQWTYRCRSQQETGSIVTRMNKGLSIEGICDTPWVKGWELEAMLQVLFAHIWKHRDKIINDAVESLKEIMLNNSKQATGEIDKQLATYEQQLENLLELRLIDAITKEQYLNKKEKIEMNIKKLKKNPNNGIIDIEREKENIERRINELSHLFCEKFDACRLSIPDEIIDAFVEKIIVHKDCVEWFLSFTPESKRCVVNGRKNKHEVIIL